jgi:hypothetical protein
MEKNPESRPVVVFSGSQMEIAIIQTLLEDNEIEFFLQDEFIGTMAPWYAEGGGAGSVKIVVADSDVEKAQVVIEEYYKNIRQ